MKTGTTKIKSCLNSRFLSILKNGSVGSTSNEDEAAEFYVIYY